MKVSKEVGMRSEHQAKVCIQNGLDKPKLGLGAVGSNSLKEVEQEG